MREGCIFAYTRHKTTVAQGSCNYHEKGLHCRQARCINALIFQHFSWSLKEVCSLFQLCTVKNRFDLPMFSYVSLLHMHTIYIYNIQEILVAVGGLFQVTGCALGSKHPKPQFAVTRLNSSIAASASASIGITYSQKLFSSGFIDKRCIFPTRVLSARWHTRRVNYELVRSYFQLRSVTH